MPQRQICILHGMSNIAGIGRYLAEWQRSHGAIADLLVYEDNNFFMNSHFSLHINSYPRIKRIFIKLFVLLLALAKYNIFHFYFGNTILPYNIDLPILKLFGKKIIMTYCGSDIRLIEVEKQRNPYCHFMSFPKNSFKLDKKKKRMMRWQNYWVDIFIAPRLLYKNAIQIIPPEKVIKDLWIHNLMDIGLYHPTFSTHEVPLIVHAPSNPEIKGSVYVKRAIEELQMQGYQFKYLHLENKPHSEVINIIRDKADIIIDQLLLGGFGTLAIEGMYYGKPVCGYILDSLLQEIPDLPIVNCTIENLAEKLAWLIEHPEERIRIGKAGRAFVEQHFDINNINSKLWQIYLKLLNN